MGRGIRDMLSLDLYYNVSFLFVFCFMLMSRRLYSHSFCSYREFPLFWNPRNWLVSTFVADTTHSFVTLPFPLVCKVHLRAYNLFIDIKFQVTESGKQERHLVATVGKFSVIWDFHQVKNSAHDCYRNQQGLKSCYCYKIVLKDESIVESRFMHDKFAVSDSPEAPLVVATPMKVSSISLSGKRWEDIVIDDM